MSSGDIAFAVYATPLAWNKTNKRLRSGSARRPPRVFTPRQNDCATIHISCSDNNESQESGKRTAKSSTGPSILTLTQKIADVRDTYRKVADEVQALQDSPDGLVLGSDLSNFSIGSNALVRDMPLPVAPMHWGLSPDTVMSHIDTYLSKAGASSEQRESVAKSCADILSALRGWTLTFADRARPMLLADDSSAELCGEALADPSDALVSLLQMAGFAILPDLPKVDDPPAPDALALGNSIQENQDPTLMQSSAVLRKHVAKNGAHVGPPSYYPHLFIATRGASLVRNSGQLISQKMRAIERTYLSWVTVPFMIFWKPARALKTYLKDIVVQTPEDNSQGSGNDRGRAGNDMKRAAARPKNNSSENVGTSNEGFSRAEAENRIRRVVPAVKIGKDWNSLKGLFLPTFTQEPAYEHLVLLHREIDLDKDSIRQQKKDALREGIVATIKHAVDPTRRGDAIAKQTAGSGEATSFDKFERAPGKLQPVSLQVYTDVAWGKVHHLYPSTFVLPVTRDLLRIDAITFTGLVSTFFTFLQHAGSVFVFAVLAGSLGSYIFRVGTGWRKASLVYNGKIAEERASSLIARQRGCLDYLSGLAAEELLVEACCVWLADFYGVEGTSKELQKDIFGHVNMTEGIVSNWRGWLENAGFQPCSDTAK